MSASTSHHHSTNGSHMRLTRRGRVLVLAVLVAVLFAAFSLGRSASQASPPPAVPVPAPAVVTVEAGESLWSLAQRAAPDNDPREVVAHIRELNDLSTAHLVPGQQLLLPVAA
jgi:LysM repeat protein